MKYIAAAKWVTVQDVFIYNANINIKILEINISVTGEFI